ncbi:MAG: 16S rRNA (cytosine(1402)-N(4))-methyltransferase, partial [Planctomycetota bacterium]|nr:16S rRNA (cytosine(1402)-N(4))-methyltransferase [Planctomycetota bacterium]
MLPDHSHAHTVRGTEAHTPVLAREVVEALTLEPRAVVVDGTAGSGGHTEALLQGLSRHPEQGIVLAIDTDPQAAELLSGKFRGNPSVRVRHANYVDLRD